MICERKRSVSGKKCVKIPSTRTLMGQRCSLGGLDPRVKLAPVPVLVCLHPARQKKNISSAFSE